MASNMLALLSVGLAADTAAFQGDMGKAARIAEKEMNGIKDAAGKMGMAVAAGLVAAGGAFAAMAKQSIDAADEMNDLSSRVGVSVESLSALSYAAKMSGTDTQTLATGFQKLNSNVMDAARGQGAAKDAFAALGISVKGANGEIKTSEQIMREVADRFTGFEDGAAKSAMAVDIFGKSGADLIPMLNEGSEGLDSMRAEAEAMGQVMSGETAAGAAAVNDNIDQMRLMMGGAVNQVTAGMLPAFRDVTEIMKRTAQDTGLMTSIANGLSVAFKGLVSVAIAVKAAFSLAGDSIGKVMAAIAAAARGDFKAAKDILFDTSASQSLSDSLTNIRDLWVGVTAEANTASVAQQNAKGAAPQYAAGGKGGAAGKGKAKAGAKAKATDWDAAIMDTIGEASKEAGSAQAVFDREKAAAASAVASIQQSMMTKQQLLAQDMAKGRQDLQAAVQMEVISEQQKNVLLEQLEADHKAKIKALDDEEMARKQAYGQMAVGFAGSALSAIGARSQSAAKAGMALQKAMALNQIRTDTPTAAMAAAKAVAGIPVIGPALAVGAKIAMYAMGAAQAASVMAGGSTSASGGGGGFSVPTTAPAASSVEPAYVSRNDDRTKNQTTIVKMPENRAMTSRQFVEWLDEAFGDGATLQNVRFMV